MTVGSVLSLLLAIFKAIPILDKWFERLVAAYVAAKIKTMEKENREAIERALNEHDQRPVEQTINSTQNGQLSGNPGTSVRGPRVREPRRGEGGDLAD